MSCYVLTKASIVRLLNKVGSGETRSTRVTSAKEISSFLKMNYLLSKEDPLKYMSPFFCNSNIFLGKDESLDYPRLIAQYLLSNQVLLDYVRRHLVRIQRRDKSIYYLKLARLNKYELEANKHIREIRRIDNRLTDEAFTIETEDNLNNISARHIYIEDFSYKKRVDLNVINISFVNFIVEQDSSIENIIRAIVENYRIAHICVSQIFGSSGPSRNAEGKVIDYAVLEQYVVVLRTDKLELIFKELKLRDLDKVVQLVSY